MSSRSDAGCSRVRVSVASFVVCLGSGPLDGMQMKALLPVRPS